MQKYLIMGTNRETAYELADKTGLRAIECCSHWNLLHTHSGDYCIALVVSDKEDEKELEDEEGVWAIACRRDGEHYSTYSAFYDIESAKERLSAWDDSWFVHESFEDYFNLKEKISECETFEDLEELYNKAKASKEYAEIYFTFSDGTIVVDGGGNPVDEPSEYGYREDVYSYSLVFIPETKND